MGFSDTFMGQIGGSGDNGCSVVDRHEQHARHKTQGFVGITRNNERGQRRWIVRLGPIGGSDFCPDPYPDRAFGSGVSHHATLRKFLMENFEFTLGMLP